MPIKGLGVTLLKKAESKAKKTSSLMTMLKEFELMYNLSPKLTVKQINTLKLHFKQIVKGRNN